MINLVMFNTVGDLAKLTGLSTDNHNQALWDAGFDLDDWDFGFVSDTEWTEDCNKKHPYYEYWILNRMDRQGVGYEHVEYNGKHYYMSYHA